ncbi:MAG: bifunctional phosphoribosylaminoimidazolecarboxamide formyltransferase/IMP cyclohydrolase [Elusimicrobia bacterium]|nr:bifunctional phosphoribosylaminoimidazolecarboxamide formyltransferase/IMP cyclohydrolase [Elusimicrobiota bacterium]
MAAKPERYALLSVTDKTGIVEFGYALKDLGFKLISHGGTAGALRQAELEVMDLRDLVKSPDILEGRLGFLHPRILIGLTADRDKPGQMHELERRHSVPIDLVAVNLYPVAEIIGDAKLSQTEVLEFIDLAGSALLRAAARNFRSVVPLCDPDDYQPAVEALKRFGKLSVEKSQTLAAKAFHYSAYYDTTVAQYLGERWDKLPDELVIGLKKTVELAYGENPQQQGALYTLSGSRPWGINAAELVYGKPLTYNHYLDLEVAWELATEIGEASCVVVKHGVPVGAASDEKLAAAARLAFRCDPRGGFGGTAAVNRELEEDAAAIFAEQYVGCVAAPQFSPKALLTLKAKKDIRLVTLPSTLISAHELDLKAVAGGVLVQDKDSKPLAGDPRPVTRRTPSDLEHKALRLAWHVAKHARTHAAVICRGSATLGIGSGQTSRLDAVRLAVVKSQERHPILPAGAPMVLASDGALSAEHIHEAAAGGISALIQPGGSSEDRDAVEAADRKSLAMLFTGVRHFRH